MRLITVNVTSRLDPDPGSKKAPKEKTIKIPCFEELDILSGGQEVCQKDVRNTNFNKYIAIKRRNFFPAENLSNMLMFVINLSMNPI